MYILFNSLKIILRFNDLFLIFPFKLFIWWWNVSIVDFLVQHIWKFIEF